MKKLAYLVSVGAALVISNIALAESMQTGAILRATVEKPLACNITSGGSQDVALGYEGNEGGIVTLRVETNRGENAQVSFIANSIKTTLDNEDRPDAVIWHANTNNSLLDGNDFLGTDAVILTSLNPLGQVTLNISPKVRNGIEFRSAESIATVTISCEG